MKLNLKYILLPILTLSVFGCNLTLKGEKENDEEVTETITKEEFDDAVEFRNKNMTYLGYKKTNGAEQKTAEVYFLEDGSMYQAKDNNLSYYWKRQENNTFHYITKKGNYYVVTDIVSSYEYFSVEYGDDAGINDMVSAFKDQFEKLTFNGKTLTFTGKVHNDYLGDVDATLKFEHKHLMECKMVNDKAEYRIEAKNYGTTTIDFDSLNVKNNLRVSGRTFGFVDCATDSILYAATAKKVSENNQESTLTFFENGSFEFDMKYDFLPPNEEKVYRGSYSFNEFNKTLTASITSGSSSQSFEGTLQLDPKNYESGAILNMYVTSLGFSVVFKIK